jgi:hypothetical protein
VRDRGQQPRRGPRFIEGRACVEQVVEVQRPAVLARRIVPRFLQQFRGHGAHRGDMGRLQQSFEHDVAVAVERCALVLVQRLRSNAEPRENGFVLAHCHAEPVEA